MAEGLKNEAFTLFLLFYYTQVVGLFGTLSGQAILIALLFDAVTDPLAGALSDRLESRWGRWHPFLYASPLPLAVSFYLVFVPPAGLSQMELFAWLATFAVLTRASMTLWGVCTATSVFVGLGYWRREAGRLDKKPVFIRVILMFTAFTVGATFSKLLGFWPAKGSPADIPLFILTTGILAHFGIASTMVTGRSMMADVCDEDELIHGRNREGIFFGATSFAAKAFFGVGSQIAGLVVDLVGLEPGARPEEVGSEVVRGLGLSLGLSVLLLVGLSIAIFSRYDLTRERHAQVRARLDARKGETGRIPETCVIFAPPGIDAPAPATREAGPPRRRDPVECP